MWNNKVFQTNSGKAGLEKVVFLVQIDVFSDFEIRKEYWLPMFFCLEKSSSNRKTNSDLMNCAKAPTTSLKIQ